MAGRKVVSVALEAKVQGFISGMRSAKASVDDLTKATAQSKQAAFDDLSNKAAVAGGAIAVGLGVAVKRFAEFDAAMSAVQANSGATGAELDALRQAALDLGADSQFSAKEAADGINELSKAGVGAKDILGGGLKGSLDLAAAGQIGVGEAAETAATAMTQFNLEGSEIPHVADLLTNAANKAQGGVGDLAQALKQGGLVAASTGLSIDETTASLAAFASAGLTGSDAGTSLKTMLQRLSAPSKESAALMEKLGISAYDASGEFVGMESLAGQLQEGLGDLTAEQRNSALATIFGSDAVRAANILYAEGAQGISKWTDEVTEQGAAAKQAAILNDNLKGDVERLGGALDSVFIQTGSGANSSLRLLTQAATGLVDQVGKIPGPLLLIGGAFASTALMAPRAITAYRDYKQSLDDVGLSVDKIRERSPRAATALSLVSKAAVGLAVFEGARILIGGLDSALSTAVPPAYELAKALGEVADAGDLSAINKQIDDLNVGPTDGSVRDLGDAIKYLNDMSKAESVRNWGQGLVGVTSDADKLREYLSGVDTELSALYANDPSAARDQWAIFSAATRSAGLSTEDLRKSLPLTAKAQREVGSASDDAAPRMDEFTSSTEAAEAQAEESAKAIDTLSNAISKMGGGLRAERAAVADWKTALADFAEVEGFQAQSAALDDLSQKALDVAAAQIEMGRGSDIVAADLGRAREQIIQAGVDSGRSRAFMESYADAMGLIPDDVRTQVEAVGVTASTASVMALDDSIQLLNGKTVTVKQAGAMEAKGNVLELDGSILGLKGKTVKVTEIGSTASGDRVVQLGNNIWVLKGKSVDVVARTSGEQALANLQAQINRMSGRDIHVNTYMNEYRSITDMGTYKARALGGLDVHGVSKMAQGGMIGPGQMRPGIYKTRPGGILMAEDTTAPAEAYISLRKDLEPRSRMIASEVVGMLGGQVMWGDVTAMASGGIYSRWQSQLRNVQALSNRYRWEDGSRQIQVFEDGTARWRGWGAPPAAVSRAINALNAAQDRYEAELNRQEAARRKAQQRQAQQRAAQQKAQRRATAQKAAQEKAARRQAELQRRIAEQRRIAREGWSESTGKKYAGRSFVRSDSIKPSPHLGRTYVAPSVSSRGSSGSGGSGGIDGRQVGAQVAAAVGKEMRSWKPMVEISGQRFYGLMVKTKRDRKGRG